MGFDSFVSRSEELLESDGDMCEESTKFRIVSPFLRECGWDLQSIEVIPEYSISIGTGTKHADFALMGESSVRVLVEVKSASSEITSRNVKQLKSYMRQEIGVKWGLITNGKSYKLFTKNDDNSESEFLEFDLKDLEDNPRFVEVIKKENIKTGESENIRKDISSIRESKENIRNEEEEIVNEILDVFDKRLETSKVDIGEKSRSLVQDILSELGEVDLEDNYKLKEDDIEENTAEESEDNNETEEKQVEDKFKVLIKTDSEEIVIKEENQSETLAKSVDYLLKNTNLYDNIQLPFSPENRKRDILNDENKCAHSGGEFESYKKIYNDNLYLNTHYSKSAKKKILREIASNTDAKIEF